MQVTGVINTVEASGSVSVTVGGGNLNVAGHVMRGWKNMSSHLSMLIENPDSRSHENTCCAALASLSVVAWYVGLDAKMFPSSTYSVRSVSSQVSVSLRIGPVTRAERMGERGLPCGVPNSGSRVSVV
jgi:hypothetical protein